MALSIQMYLLYPLDCFLQADVVFIEISGKLKELCQIFAGVENVEILHVSPTLGQYQCYSQSQGIYLIPLLLSRS
jgi:hypothetical protein